MKKRILLIVLSIVIIVVTINAIAIHQHNQRKTALNNAILAIDSDTVTLNEIVPFEWDTVYTFPPYTPREEMEETIGIQSTSLTETVSEGMIQLIFVKNHQIVLDLCTAPDNVDFDIKFDSPINYSDQTIFTVTKTQNQIKLIESDQP